MDDDMCGCSKFHFLMFSREQHTEFKVKGSFEKQVYMYTYV